MPKVPRKELRKTAQGSLDCLLVQPKSNVDRRLSCRCKHAPHRLMRNPVIFSNLPQGFGFALLPKLRPHCLRYLVSCSYAGHSPNRIQTHPQIFGNVRARTPSGSSVIILVDTLPVNAPTPDEANDKLPHFVWPEILETHRTQRLRQMGKGLQRAVIMLGLGDDLLSSRASA